jgi:hypothetical protein
MFSSELMTLWNLTLAVQSVGKLQRNKYLITEKQIYIEKSKESKNKNTVRNKKN